MAGLRERKKAATRQAISDVATRMFIHRGFDAVTIAEVAAAADVSVNTLLNYFGTKEELFFDRAEEVVDAPARLVRDRPPGTDPLDALHAGLRAVLTDAPERLFSDQILAFVRTIDDSPSLRAHLSLLFEQAEARLAAALDVPEARPGAALDVPGRELMAALVIALVRRLTATLRARIQAGEPHAATRESLLSQGDAGFAVLVRGFGCAS
jgi:AcrR family transcriptional regulator